MKRFVATVRVGAETETIAVDAGSMLAARAAVSKEMRELYPRTAKLVGIEVLPADEGWNIGGRDHGRATP